MDNELEKFYAAIESIDTAMMTTRRSDGHLRSRAMANQKRAGGADLWFVCRDGSAKLEDLAQDPHVNLSYYRDSNREWISVSGTAIISRDRGKIAELYAPDWKIWFDQEGDPRHGTVDDPRMVLIGVTVHAAEFLEINKSKPVLLYESSKDGSQEPSLNLARCTTWPNRDDHDDGAATIVAFGDAAAAGVAATLTTTAAIVLIGHEYDESAWAPLNAVSHILWGDEAATHTEKSLAFTAGGAALNASAMLSWGAVHAGLLTMMPRRTPAAAIGAGVATAALAYLTDYYVVPRRLTPGFEQRLTGGEMACIYAALAVGLAAGTLARAPEVARRRS